MKLKATKTLANELNKKIDKYNIYGVIVVEYPYNYYACNKYITTNDLIKIWKNTNDKTINGLAKAFCEFVEI